MSIIYFLLIIISALFFTFYSDNLSFILMAALIAFPLMLFIQLIISVCLIRVKIKADDDYTEHGKPFRLRFRIVNKSIFPVSSCLITIKYITDNNKVQKHSTVIPLSARSTESVIFNIKNEHCGIIECSVKNIKFTDLAGIFSVWKKVNFLMKIPVLPVKYPFETTILYNQSSDTESLSYSDTKQGDDPSEVFDLREYRAGDLYNRIHWKLSSRNDDFIVKELSNPVNSNVLIIPDVLSCGSINQTDDVLDIYAAFAYFLSKKQLSFFSFVSENEHNLVRINNTYELIMSLKKQVCSLSNSKNSKNNKNDKYKDSSVILSLIDNEEFLNSRYSHIICIVTKYNSELIHEMELLNTADRISIICLGENKSDYEELSKFSEIVVYNTVKENFYEDLRNFII